MGADAPRRRLAGAALALVAAAAGGCGGAEGDAAPAPEGRRGGLLTVLALEPVATLDPAAARSPVELAIAHATQRPLYSHRPGDPKRMVPDLAGGPPGLAPDGRKVTVAIRPGVRFGPPVGRAVTSGDVKYAIERALARGAGAPGSLYFSDLIGARAFAAGRARDVAGIEAPDDRRLVFRLGRPTGGALAAALSLPLTAPVPPEYAAPLDRRGPGYGQRPVATGPYRARAPAAAGGGPGPIDLVRNPSWERRTDERPAFLDRIRVTPAAGDAAAAAQRVAEGRGVVTAGLPPDGAALAAAARAEREKWTRLVRELGIKPEG